MRTMNALGAVHYRQEGAPIHPDDTECDMSPEMYKKQLDAYNACYGVNEDTDE